MLNKSTLLLLSLYSNGALSAEGAYSNYIPGQLIKDQPISFIAN